MDFEFLKFCICFAEIEMDVFANSENEIFRKNHGLPEFAM